MRLPLPASQGKVSVEQAIKQRRTIRSFSSRALNLNQLAQLLWSASGITEENGYKRAAPSAGALYPMDIYVIMGQDCVPSIEAGVYHYTPATHQLVEVLRGDRRSMAARASLSRRRTLSKVSRLGAVLSDASAGGPPSFGPPPVVPPPAPIRDTNQMMILCPSEASIRGERRSPSRPRTALGRSSAARPAAVAQCSNVPARRSTGRRGPARGAESRTPRALFIHARPTGVGTARLTGPRRSSTLECDEGTGD